MNLESAKKIWKLLGKSCAKLKKNLGNIYY